MKTVMIIIDGLGDEPIPELDGATPLEASFAPNMHYIASRGRIGRIRTTFPGYPIESMVCIMGLLGYEPERFYPHGRASFEAMAKGIPLHPGDLVLRCNTITVDPVARTLADFTAGMISDSKARQLLSRIELPYDNWELYPGQSYRNILIIRGAQLNPKMIKCCEPHMYRDSPVADILPMALDPAAESMVQRINAFLLDSQAQIARMDLPSNCTANMLWVWSPSIKPIWPSFRNRTGKSAAFVGGLDFLHGIAMAAGIHFDVIPGATGYLDTDYHAKAKYTIDYLKSHDFVLTHINAADEEAHQRNPFGKKDSIEKIDDLIVGPVLSELVRNYPGSFRIVVCGDHATSSVSGKHLADPVPYAMYGANFSSEGCACFSESTSHGATPTDSLRYLKDVVWNIGNDGLV